jgi:hypothetical protein
MTSSHDTRDGGQPPRCHQLRGHSVAKTPARPPHPAATRSGQLPPDLHLSTKNSQPHEATSAVDLHRASLSNECAGARPAKRDERCCAPRRGHIVTTYCRVPHRHRPSDAILALCRPHAPAVARGEENVRGGGGGARATPVGATWAFSSQVSSLHE